MSFESEYKDLVIKQYYDRPKASAEIGLQATTWRKTFDWLNSFPMEFDLDHATGDRLDIIGRIVGVSRNVPQALIKELFGFADNPNSKGFSSKFSVLFDGGPFSSKFAPDFTDLQLDDNDYRLFIRVKIAKNVAHAYMVDGVNVTIQDAVIAAFGGRAYILDNYNMTSTIYISPIIDADRISLILRLDLIPHGVGVGYSLVVQAEPGETFGFSNNVDAKGFSSKFDTAYDGGIFARKVI
jgi:hypothetical protein